MKPLDPRLLRYAKATRIHIAICVALGVATAGLILAQAELLSRGISGVVSSGVRPAAFSGVMLGLLLVIGGRVAVAWLQDSASQRSSAAVKSQLRRRLIGVAASQGPQAEAAGRAEVATLAVRGLDALDNYFGRYLPQLVLATIVPIVVLARLAPADMTAAVIVAVTLPLIPVFMILVGMTTEAANAKRWAALERLSHHFLDVVSGLTTLKIFGRARAQADSVRRSTDRYRTETMATLRIAFLSSFVLELVATLSVALVAVSIGLRLVNGHVDLRTGLLVIILAPEAYLPLRQVGAQYHAAAEGVAAAEQVFAILETPSGAPGPGTSASLATVAALATASGRGAASGRGTASVQGAAIAGTRRDVPSPWLRHGCTVRVSDVSVTHRGRAGSAPHGATLSVSPGELVVVAGPSGAGKTTLLAVLLGFVAPTSGAVTVEQHDESMDLSVLDLDTWRQQIAWVDQRPYLFAGTIADNVRLSLQTAADEKVRAALDAAGLSAMPLERRVDEHGRGLSAGEQRRVALARAVLRDAALVLLDEPTAGLDEATERDVLDAIKAMSARSAVVMASHRPAAIAIADRVVTITSSDGASLGESPMEYHGARLGDAGTPRTADGDAAITASGSVSPGESPMEYHGARFGDAGTPRTADIDAVPA